MSVAIKEPLLSAVGPNYKSAPPGNRSPSDNFIVGDDVFYWRYEDGVLVPVPAKLVRRSMTNSNEWYLVGFSALGTGTFAIQPCEFSQTPAADRWTARDRKFITG